MLQCVSWLPWSPSPRSFQLVGKPSCCAVATCGSPGMAGILKSSRSAARRRARRIDLSQLAKQERRHCACVARPDPSHVLIHFLFASCRRNASAGLAQLVVHLICNQGVGGSSPSAGIKLPDFSRPLAFVHVQELLEMPANIRSQRFHAAAVIYASSAPPAGALGVLADCPGATGAIAATLTPDVDGA
jgi:hypothetical protein